MNLGHRIKEARELLNWSTKHLADKSGVANTTISALESRDSLRSQYSERLIAAFPADKINYAYIRTGKGQVAAAPSTDPPSNVISLHPDDHLPDGFLYIKVSSIAFSAGNGNSPHIELIEDSDPVVYASSWFQKRQINPEKVRRYKVTDHSMEPFLYDGDTVLVNHAEVAIKDGKVYAFRYGDDLRIKQIYQRLDGTLILHSINPAHKDEEVSAALASEHIAIIGRVRDKSGSGGL